MKIIKKLLNVFLSVALLATVLPPQRVRAEKITPAEITVYENTFDRGTSSIKRVVNEYMKYDNSNVQNIENAAVDGNQGIRARRESWMATQTFLFDFTKDGGKEGVSSGILTASFDFSMDEQSTADHVIVGINMSNTYSGGRMIYFYNNSSYEIMASYGNWGNGSAAGTVIDADSVHNMKIVMSLDDGKAYYYLDNTLVATQTNWTGVTVNNFSIAMAGVMDYFDNLKLTLQFPNAIENTVTSNNIGNIFYGDEPMVFDINVKNRHSEKITEAVNVKIKDAYGSTVYDKTENVTVTGEATNTISIMPNITKFGTYFMTVTSENAPEFKLRLSRCVKADELNYKSGICAHFDGRHPMDVSGMFDIMQNAGFGTVRTDWGWKLNSDGTVYDFIGDGSYFEKTIKEANESGIDILAILGVSHSNYSSLNEDGGLNTADEALAALKSYSEQVARELDGKVELFEIGNEDNYTKRYASNDDVGVNRIVLSNGRTLIDSNYVYTYPTGDYNSPTKYALSDCTVNIEKVTVKNDSGVVTDEYASLTVTKDTKILNKVIKSETIHSGMRAYVFESGENYAKILKAAYEGIKAGNPDAIVSTSGSSISYTDPDGTANRNNREFAKGLLSEMKNENYYYFDVFGTHPYHVAQAPEVVDRWIQNQTWGMAAARGQELFDEYDVPEDKTLWATEFGYSSRDTEEDSSGSLKIAAWIVRTMLVNEIGGYHDKMYLYDILNDGLQADNSEHNFGTICYCKNEKWNNVTAYAAKPQYLAMAQYNKMLAGAQFVKNTVDGGVYKAEFAKGRDKIVVVWDINNSGSTVTLDNGNNVTAYDYFGNTVGTFSENDTVSVTAGEAPVYVKYSGEEKVVYENTFDNGAADLTWSEGDYYIGGYDSEKADDAQYPNGGLKPGTVTVDGNTGIAMQSGQWSINHSMYFDFTKGGELPALTSGSMKISFDFSMAKSNANWTGLGLNMNRVGSDNTQGHQFMSLQTAKTDGQATSAFYNIKESSGSYIDYTQTGQLEFDKINTLDIYIDFAPSCNMIYYWLNGEKLDISTRSWLPSVSSFAISMSGAVGYFDNLKISYVDGNSFGLSDMKIPTDGDTSLTAYATEPFGTITADQVTVKKNGSVVSHGAVKTEIVPSSPSNKERYSLTVALDKPVENGSKYEILLDSTVANVRGTAINYGMRSVSKTAVPQYSVAFGENTADVKILNRTDESATPVVYVCIYDDEERLVRAEEIKGSYKVDGKTASCIKSGEYAEINVYTYPGYDNVRIFTVDSAEHLKPLGAAVKK